MKKIVISLLSFIVVSFMVTTPIKAQTDEALLATPTPLATVSAVSEYQLPFPGMLPDHPLYFLKRVRDYILERLISEPVRKAGFYILQADKRLQMGIQLIDNGKGLLGEQTISKGTKYFVQAETLLSQLKKDGTTVPSYIVEQMEKSLGKHKSVIEALIEKTDGEVKQGLQGSLALVEKLITDVEGLK